MKIDLSLLKLPEEELKKELRKFVERRYKFRNYCEFGEYAEIKKLVFFSDDH